MLRRSSFFAKRHTRLTCSVASALTTVRCRCYLFAICGFAADISFGESFPTSEQSELCFDVLYRESGIATLFRSYYLKKYIYKLFFHVPVINHRKIIALRKKFPQFFRYCHRTVLAACTANADHKLHFPLNRILRQKEQYHVFQLL